MNVRRYLLITAAIWLAAGLALVLRLGGLELLKAGFSVLLTRDGFAMLFGVPVGLSLASVFGALVVMTRFPGLGGATYFGPTVVNVFLLLVVLMAALGTR